MRALIAGWLLVTAVGCGKDAGGGGAAAATGGRSSGSGGAVGSGGRSGGGTGGAASSGSSGGSALTGSGGGGVGGAVSAGGAAGGLAVGMGGGAGVGPGMGLGGGPPRSAILVEDNFDTSSAGGPPDPTRWAAYPAGQEAAAPVVDTARAHSGANAARVSSTSSGLGSFLVPVSGLPVPSNAFYVRVYINWEKATTTISGHSGFLVGAAARDESATEVRLGISTKGPNGVPRMDLNLQSPADGGGETTRYSNGFTDGGNPADFPDTGFQFAANTWTCLEAFFNGDPAGSEFRLWIAGAELATMHVLDFRGSPNGAPRTHWAPTYNYVKIGANDYDANLGHIWYDDVVVATQRIGCDYLP